jgi:hypothetical protein
MKLDWATEPLLSGEVAPMFEASRYTIPASGYCPGRYTCFKFAAFGRRLIVGLVR